ncbi:MAG: proline/glycine betaine ABC transporter permease [Syntrophomonadaceae bacterium]|nr:proline/glycine betaine ABC transporter permease [Syntrophomonadaceae bacterium]MDD3023718.1 proline/glycine betaine ABC transporter permease [Syntrophomonadaceae bacterium]
MPRMPLNHWTDIGINYLQLRFGNSFDSLSDFLENMIISLQDYLLLMPPALLITLFALLSWKFANKKVALFSIIGMYLIYNVGLWDATMQTLAMVIGSVALCIIIGLPLGILSAKREAAHRIISPILDFMQTLPAFVYLLPAVTFFGLGVVPAVIATLIFAMPPVIRLTDLGIRQVPEELVELGKSFGSTFYQMLFKIELPLARPTIMAGINQCIMLSLSMVVISAMIGAKGLGGEVWRSIQRMEIGTGFEAGLAIVVIAIILDRITQSFGKSNE